LGVRAVLTGHLTQHGDNLTVNAELVKVDDDSQLWGELYNRKLVDALADEQDIATQISGKLRAKLSNVKALIAKGQTQPRGVPALFLKDATTPRSLLGRI
jgi:hypothetical protein